MAFNGTGTFLRIYNWVTDKVNAIPITASRVDAEMDGMATGLSNCITKDGQTTISANIPLNSFKLTGLGVGTARTDAITVGQVQDNQFLYLGTTSGTADAYTLAPSPAITAYAATQQFTAKISATNLTTTPYLQISSIASPTTTAVIKKLSATKTEIAVEANDLLINGIYTFKRNSANDAWIVLELSNRKSPTVQKFTSGSGTYTTPAGTLYFKVRMTGGGGGGGGSGVTGGTGGTGGNSTFGTSLLTANGGIGGAYNAQGASGGSPTVSSPAISILDVVGNNGGSSDQAKTAPSTAAYGGIGGSNPISGVAASNTGAGGLSGKLGGGGAGGGAGGVSVITGAGAGAGAYIEAIIPNPSATYSYSVASGGVGGIAGTSGFAGGAGGNGLIEITEYYN